MKLSCMCYMGITYHNICAHVVHICKCGLMYVLYMHYMSAYGYTICANVLHICTNTLMYV